jgi:tagaturonate reductase
MIISRNNPSIEKGLHNPLPAKVLQFGTGVLLRGLCDDIIDKANKSGIFEGGIVVVKSTGNDVSEFTQQDFLYTIYESGLKDGQQVKNFNINESIINVLSAENDWHEILNTAENKDLQIVISNTTEAGLVYEDEQFTAEKCSVSFPGKLCQWLLKRYQTNQVKTVIIPTELIVDNGQFLKNIVVKLATENKYESGFFDWLNDQVSFCSSLVDRIVPGKPAELELSHIWQKLGYEDKLLIKVEPYTLWAIEGRDLEDILTFIPKNSDRVLLTPNIEKYRELKLRLLNAPHTLMSGVAFLSGYKLVKDAMQDEFFVKYINNLMLTELASSISLKTLDDKVKQRYIMQVLDRFKNESIEHLWKNICVQYTLKMKSRVIPLLLAYYQKYNAVPHYLVRCFAAYLYYMKSVDCIKGEYFGVFEGQQYRINCDYAAYFAALWNEASSVEDLVQKCLQNQDLWGSDLNTLEGFAEHTASHLSNIQHIGVKDALASLNVFA